MYSKVINAAVLLSGVVSCTAQEKSDTVALTPKSEQTTHSDSGIHEQGHIPTTTLQKKNMGTIHRTEAEWKAILTPQEYSVLREAATDRPFTGEYVHKNDAGVYECRACGAPLYSSTTKFDSHCGWPSFYDAIDSGAIVESRDTSLGMVRTELTCAKCGSHLGHIFDDGPQPTGMRHCINSTSLRFRSADDTKK